MSTSRLKVLNGQLGELPDGLREKVVKYISEHLEDIMDEMRWDDSFARTAPKLEEFARQARKQMQEGKTEEMDFSKL